MPEFTGERIVPGLVDADLFNEHIARYEFAARLVAGQRVLDAGCGSGYGAAVVAGRAASVAAIDFSDEAIAFARETFPAPNLHFQVGNCSLLPDGPFDSVLAFEVIEHLPDWHAFLKEARRVLAPGGRLFVSTPNKIYYAESRGDAGENPFHIHEFEYREFCEELAGVFPHVSMFFQNHVGAIAFTPVDSMKTEFQAGSVAAVPEQAHFFFAMCSAEQIPPAEAFVWIPTTGNVLREREHHIALLTGEIALKDTELEIRNREYQALLQMFREANGQLEERNRWAIDVRQESEARGARVLDLQAELAAEQQSFAATAAAYRAKVAELETADRMRSEWARSMESQLTGQADELGRCVALLDRAERTVTERTLWAQALQHELEFLKSEAAAFRALRWVKAGTKIGFVPQQR